MQQDNKPKYAVFTFFKLNGCGPCNAFYGDAGNGTPNPNGPWESLSHDAELVDKDGVEFILFKFGTVRDASGQVTDFLEVPKVYETRVTSAPYLELRLPNDVSNGIRYMGDRSDWKNVKAWVKEQLNSPTFKNYKDAVNQGKTAAMGRPEIQQQMEIIKNAADPQVSDNQLRAFYANLQNKLQSRQQVSQAKQQTKQPSQEVRQQPSEEVRQQMYQQQLRQQQQQLKQEQQRRMAQQQRMEEEEYEIPQRYRVNVAGMGANEPQEPIETREVVQNYAESQPTKRPPRFLPSNY